MMSYIDTIKHELVGQFNGLPIYHPLESETSNQWGDYDFNCTPDNLVLGGGAGEHPALVLHDLGGLSAYYILHCIENSDLPKDTINRVWDIAHRTKEHLEFCGWSMGQIHRFVENSKSEVNNTPFNSDTDNIENWIKYSIGEFIFYSLPELNPDYQEIINLEGMKDNFLGYWFCNVTCPPPNYIKSRKQAMQETGFEQNGFFRWDFIYSVQDE